MGLGSWRRRLRARPLIQQLEIRDVVARALEFQERLAAARVEATAPEPGWYPWDSFGTLTRLNELLTGRHRYLEPMIGDDPVSGFGVRRRRPFVSIRRSRVPRARGRQSSHQLQRHGGRGGVEDRAGFVGADRGGGSGCGVRLPVARCGLALCLGILYHLKNPYGVLEALARRARYCLLSTAITRFAPDQTTGVNEMAVAFLAGRDGLARRRDELLDLLRDGAADARGPVRVGRVRLAGGGSGGFDSVEYAEGRARVLSAAVAELRAAPVSQLLVGLARAGEWRVAVDGTIVFADGRARGAARQLEGACAGDLAFPLVLRAVRRRSGTRAPRDRAGGGLRVAQMAPEGAEVVVEFDVDRAMAPSDDDGRERGIVVRGVEIG